MYTALRRTTLITASVLLSLLSVTGCKRHEPTPTPTPQSAANTMEAVSPEARKAASAITADYVRAQIATISADDYEGRAPATPGDTKTRDYLVEQLKQIGVEPGGPDGGWQQTFDVVGVEAHMPKQWTFNKGS